MEKNIFHILALLLLLQSCKSVNYLKESGLETVQSENNIQFLYNEKYHTLGHNAKPWETTNYSGKGSFWVNTNTFLKQDTLTNSRGRNYVSKTDYRNNTLLYVEYGDKDLLPMTKKAHFEKIINTARYTPSIVLQYFVDNAQQVVQETTKNYASYTLKIGEFSTKIYINKATKTIDKISYLSYHELYGDVTTTFNYSLYTTHGALTYPKQIITENINGKVKDSVEIIGINTASNLKSLLEKPESYQFAEEVREETPIIKTTKYNENIHFIDLSHTNDRVMVVEFEDFMLVAEAPMNSQNGELIIAEAKKIAPNKPIKYFVFGHHHPHYLGGLRAFVHKGTTILCTDISKEYIEYIANADHSLQPDSLQLEPRALMTQVIKDSLSIGKNNPMNIYFIGEKSAHTTDYLIYYFPDEKLVFQDDLCWIATQGAIQKAGSRQAGLYHAIKELNLEVDTVIQSWPVTNHKVKTIIPFKELEASVLMKKE